MCRCIVFFRPFLPRCLLLQGSPPQCPDPGAVLGQRVLEMDGDRVVQIRNKLSLSPGLYYIYCRHCRCVKPPRTHHCGVTGRCVYHMDHYCPWMANCVGYYNYRYFVLFLLYMLIGCSYCLVLSTMLLARIAAAHR